MQVDYVLVLAAGKGTRMGEIGKSIPKVIWPVFNKSILELEVLYASQYVKKQTFINVHHYKEKICEHIKSKDTFKNVEVLIEDDVIDIGGAIHNLAQHVNYKGKLLVLNSDQFIMLGQDQWKKLYQLSEVNDSVILTYNVIGRDLYNATIREGEKLVEIRPNSIMDREKEHETYTGMSIINLESLSPHKGESKFFESVADFKNLRVGVMNIDDSKYWDFGTIRRYYNSMFDIIHKWKENEPFISFLKSKNVLDSNKVNEKNYNSNQSHVIDLAENKNATKRTIYLSQTKVAVPEQDCIVFNDIIESVDLPSF